MRQYKTYIKHPRERATLEQVHEDWEAGRKRDEAGSVDRPGSCGMSGMALVVLLVGMPAIWHTDCACMSVAGTAAPRPMPMSTPGMGGIRPMPPPQAMPMPGTCAWHGTASQRNATTA